MTKERLTLRATTLSSGEYCKVKDCKGVDNKAEFTIADGIGGFEDGDEALEIESYCSSCAREYLRPQALCDALDHALGERFLPS